MCDVVPLCDHQFLQVRLPPAPRIAYLAAKVSPRSCGTPIIIIWGLSSGMRVSPVTRIWRAVSVGLHCPAFVSSTTWPSTMPAPFLQLTPSMLRFCSWQALAALPNFVLSAVRLCGLAIALEPEISPTYPCRHIPVHPTSGPRHLILVHMLSKNKMSNATWR